MDFNAREKLWVEKYRPQTLADCILHPKLRKQLEDIVTGGHIPNLLLAGTAGIGKTTVARALCNELNVDWLIINCSEETGIDLLRTKIKDFASSISMTGNGKCVILDEFDYASHNLQSGMRNAMEAFSQNCTFIMTCNNPNKIIEAIHSRVATVDYTIPKDKVQIVQAQFFKRICDILNFEKIPFDQKAVVKLVQKFYPDNRKILGQLQQYARSGEIDAGVLNDLNDITIETLVAAMKEKSFKDVKQWCVENALNDLSSVYTKLYRTLLPQIKSSAIPEAIMILNDYQRYDSVVPDKELHCAAMAVQLMMTIEFK